jgi:hypothetical protein
MYREKFYPQRLGGNENVASISSFGSQGYGGYGQNSNESSSVIGSAV